MPILNGATPLCLRTLAVAGALIAGMAAAPAPIRAQAPAEATLCPPPPRRLSFAISPLVATRTPARRKPVAARPKVVGAALTARRSRPVVKPRRAAGAVPAAAARRKKRASRPRSVVPMPAAARVPSLARSTAVCQPWTHELAAPLVGMVATASTPTAWIPLVGAVGSPIPPPAVADDNSWFGGWWWMLPAGGVAIAGATTGGSGGEGAGVAGVEVGRGGSGTPVATAPADVPPIVIGSPGAPPTGDGTVPGDATGTPGATPGEPVFPALPPVPPVGSTTSPGSSPFTPPDGTFDLPPGANPGGAPPVGGPASGGPGSGGPGSGGPGGGVPSGPGTDVPGIEEKPPQIATAVVPEPSVLSLVLVGGGVLTLVAWGAARRS